MKKLLATLLMLSSYAYGIDLSICTGQFALCAASNATPTGKNITVKGKTFKEGMAVCPVLEGPSIADLSLMNGSCDAPKGTVWSLFSNTSPFPQAPDWKSMPAVHRTFTTSKDQGMSNMWSFPCVIQPQQINGATVAKCYGPLNESPWTSNHVKTGVKIVTDSPNGMYPVGGNLP